MEKIEFLPNGQWQLAKAWGTPTYDHLEHGDSPFKDKQTIEQAKKNVIESLKNQKHAVTKMMPNLQTGNDELHVLLHRGVSGGVNHGTEGITDAEEGPNMINFSNGKTVKTTHNSIHTSHPEEAEGHATDRDDFGALVSHWVPISSIHGNGEFIDNKLGGKEKGDDYHHLIAPGEYRVHNIKYFDNR